jgi:hypothetical protein
MYVMYVGNGFATYWVAGSNLTIGLSNISLFALLHFTDRCCQGKRKLTMSTLLVSDYFFNYYPNLRLYFIPMISSLRFLSRWIYLKAITEVFAMYCCMFLYSTFTTYIVMIHTKENFAYLPNFLIDVKCAVTNFCDFWMFMD